VLVALSSFLIETRSLPTLTHVLPPISTSRFCPSMSLASPRLRSLVAYPGDFTLITRTARVLAPATLAALPSTRAIPDRDVFYVAPPGRSILTSYFETRPAEKRLTRIFSTFFWVVS